MCALHIIIKKSPGNGSRRAGAEAFGSLRNVNVISYFVDFTQ
jgi:hypothetical protein